MWASILSTTSVLNLTLRVTRGTGMSSIELFTSRFLVERGVGWVRVSRDGRLVEEGMSWVGMGPIH